ncbi:MAG: geranylgeranylglyceryl/heptaprenylglyceryl phosphate synthase [archaeon]
MGKIYDYLLSKIKKDGAAHLTLIDPDMQSPKRAGEIAKAACEAGSDAIIVGGSGGDRSMLDECIESIKKECKLPVILFPGNVNDISKQADAIFFMSLLNSRSRYFLAQAQSMAAYSVKKAGIEPIPMGYVIIQSDVVTSVEFYGDANPIPKHKPKIAAAFALAAEYMGMKLVYYEGGSGASEPISDEMIRTAKKVIDIPLIVGGGIKTGEQAYEKVKAGADIIVTGTAVEKSKDFKEKLKELVGGVKKAGKEKLTAG